MQYHPNWNDLKLVQAIHERGNLSRAADALGVDHSTVFRNLKILEKRLGVRLFDRSRQHCSATAAGVETAEVAARCTEHIDRLMLTIAGADARLSGTIRITSTDTIISGPLPALLTEFQQQHPEIVLELVETGTHLSLSRREADIAIRPTATPPEELIARRAGEVSFSIYGQSGTAAPQALAALESLPWITADSSFSQWRGASWLRERLPKANVVCTVNTLTSLYRNVVAGMGIGLVPDYLARDVTEITRLHGPVSALTTPLWLLTHPELRNVARMRALIDFLQTRFPAVLQTQGQGNVSSDNGHAPSLRSSPAD